MNIAIDGPAGAGKSTIAKRIARKMGSIYVDTGAMYRAMALFMIKNGILPEDAESIEKACENADISIAYQDGAQHVILNGEDVTECLRTEEVGNMASATSVNKKVRAKLVRAQQDLARKTSVVMDGRDIGTVVLPDADVKIYLTASVETRAERRYKELIEKGQEADLQAIANDIRDRDYRDMNREHSPLRQAEDAVLVDSSDMTIEEVVNRILEISDQRSFRKA
ncbi:MAG: (d)CMP kinase [Lachnospiraceae bacterium]|nr:(d)CMP kinase [Lachnospiraceae bacterium]